MTYLNEIQLKINELQNHRLAGLCDTLLSKFLSSELDVSSLDIETIVEGV